VPTQDERGGNFSGAKYNDGKPVQISIRGPGSNINSTACRMSSIRLDQSVSHGAPEVHPVAEHCEDSFRPELSVRDVRGEQFRFGELRLIHNLGASSGPGFGLFGGGGGGNGGGRRSQNNINFGLNWSRSSNNIVNPFPSLAAEREHKGLTRARGGLMEKAASQTFFA